MAPRSPDQFEQMREKSRHQILRTALELFACNGYHTTSVEAVAKQAKVSKGLVYNYFRSKEELLQELILGTMAHMMADFAPLLQEPDPDKRLRGFVDGMFELAQGNMRFWSLYWSLLMQPSLPQSLRTKFVAFMRESVGMIGGAFREMGSESPDADAWMFAAMLDGLLMYYMLDPQGFSLNEIKRRIFAHFVQRR